MRTFAALAIFAVLGTAATTVWATPPGKNGQIMFRRYLDPAKTTGALFSMNADGTGVKQVTRPRRGVVETAGKRTPPPLVEVLAGRPHDRDGTYSGSRAGGRR